MSIPSRPSRQHTPDPSEEQYLYNRTVFSRTDLSNAEHTLVMTAVQGSQPSVLLFDWAVYTFDDGEPSSSSSATSTSQASRASSSGPSSKSTHHGPPIGAIAGGVLGGIAFVAICLCLVIYWWRRQRVRYALEDMDHTAIEPFVPSPSSKYQDEMPVLTAAVSETRPSPSITDARLFSEMRIEAISSSNDHSLTREAQDFKRRVTNVLTGLTPNNASTPLVSAPAPASTIRAPVSFQPSNWDSADLRRELASLRVEMAQLRAEGIQVVSPSEAPPAY